ncbi:MAG TPA: hypothetical protein VMT28_13115 [Terriglobales bacterium]|jgi:hypothetical protein|nr:hypothetical protein [Terriglobales bacterium]
MGVNRGRVFLGGLVGGVVWNIWSIADQFLIVGMGRYQAAQSAGQFLKEPRYPAFQVQWIVLLFVLAIILAHLYAWVRQTLGPGPGTALKVGFLVGFASGFPTNFGTATWAPIDRMFPLGWMLEMWVGAILATLVAGWLYKE